MKPRQPTRTKPKQSTRAKGTNAEIERERKRRVDPTPARRDGRLKVIVPEQDLPWVEFAAKRKHDLLTYERIPTSDGWPYPRTAVLLPYKIPVGEAGDHAAIVTSLRQWLQGGCHLIVILPRLSAATSNRAEGALRARTLLLLDEVLRSLVLDASDFPQGEIMSTPVSKDMAVPLRPSKVGFHLSRSILDSDWSEGFPPIAVPSGLMPTIRDLPGFAITPLARTQEGHVTAATMKFGNAHITLVPRGMLGGDLEDLNDAIPRSFNIDFQDVEAREYPASGGTPGGLLVTVRRDPQPKKWPVRAGREKSALPATLVNGSSIELTDIMRLYLRTIWERSRDFDVEDEPLLITWPKELKNSKQREHVGRELRNALRRHGLILVEPGSGRRSPRLARNVVRARYQGQGWERWESREMT